MALNKKTGGYVFMIYMLFFLLSIIFPKYLYGNDYALVGTLIFNGILAYLAFGRKARPVQ